MILALLVGVGGNMLWVLVFREFFDVLGQDLPKEVVVSGLMSTLMLIVAVEAMDVVGWRVAHFVNSHFQARVMANITNECFEYLHGHSYRFFSDNFAGSLVKKVNRIVRGFDGVAERIYWDMTPLFLKLIVILIVLIYLHPILGAIMFVWSTIFIGANYWASLYKLKFDYERSAVDSEVTGALSDSITNAHTVKLFSGLKFEMNRFGRVTDKWFEKTKKAWFVAGYFETAQAVFMVGLEVVILYAAIRLWGIGEIDVADFFVIQAYLFEMFHQLWNFGRNLRDLYEYLADSAEMTQILNTQHEVHNKKGAEKIAVNSGQVEFKNVEFSYGEGSETVLDGLSFKVKPSEKIALIGPSGGGKSTIVKLLLRLFDIDKGEILIDGQNIADVTQESLRESVALVPQDPVLFHRSLIENIRYGRRDATDEEVLAAAKLANCHDFIMKFPKKYETFVGERGVKLSGGQRQRVAIARAILSNARIVVLDEATSSLDSESEALIQDALKKLMAQKTTLVIAHRLSTIMSADRIFVLEGGKIVEEGQHADLLGRDGGLYRKLWDLQSGGYL